MKIQVQWASLTPADYEDYDSADWSRLPNRRIQSVNIQGVAFDSFEEYALEDIADGGVNLYAWHPPRPDYPGGEMTESHGHKWTFYPLAPDPLLGGAINTRQAKTTFYEPTDRRIWDQPLAGIETRRTFAEFTMPSGLVKRGVETDFGADGYLSEQAHMAARQTKGWRAWTEGLFGEEVVDGLLRPQREAGRWAKAEGTITYFQRDTNRATGVHAAANEDALELTTASLGSENATVPMGGSLFAWTFTTPSNEPNSADWPNGAYRIQLDVATSSPPFDYGFLTLDGLAGHMARVNSGLTSDLETWTQDESAFSGTGLRLATNTINPSSGAASDRFEGLLVWFDTCGCGGTVTLDLNISDSFADGPWVTTVAVTGSAEAVAVTTATSEQVHVVTATVDAVGQASGVAEQVHALTGNVSSVAQASGVVTQIHVLNGTAEAVVVAVGTLEQTHVLTGDVEAVAVAAGTAVVTSEAAGILTHFATMI